MEGTGIEYEHGSAIIPRRYEICRNKIKEAFTWTMQPISLATSNLTIGSINFHY